MDFKIKGVLLGVVAIIIWFMPFASWDQEFLDDIVRIYQAGHHIGGIAYLLLVSSFAYAVLSWFEQHQLRMIAAGVASGICLFFLVQVGKNVAWGLLALIVVSGLRVWFAYMDEQRKKMRVGRCTSEASES